MQTFLSYQAFTEMKIIKTTDTIHLNYSVEEVWNVLTDISSYPKWWPRIVHLKILDSPKEIIGTKFQASPMGGKSFSCKVRSIVLMSEIKLEYFEGIYRGNGIWRIENGNNSTTVSYIVDLEIVDKSISFLSYVIPVTKIHSMIFNKILKSLDNQLQTLHH
jgi:ribosome-associated toxin RatA of RatAB toxin-antitoxin module